MIKAIPTHVLTPYADAACDQLADKVWLLLRKNLHYLVNDSKPNIHNHEIFHSTYEIIEATDPWED